MGTGPPLPLAGVRVLECGDAIAAAYAGRLLADLGADVVKVEAAAGDALRAVEPPIGAAVHAYLHAGKRTIEQASGVALSEVAARADVVLRATRAGDDWLDDDALAAAIGRQPGLITVDISTYGRHGRSGPHPCDDLLALAAGGLLSVNATRPCDPTSTPLRYRGELSSVHAGADAVLALLGALAARRVDGHGQRIDVSMQAATAAILATAVPSYTYAGLVAAHDGRRGVAPWGFFACTDGHVLVQITEDEQFRGLCRLLGDPDWAEWEVFATTAQRIEVADVLDPLLAERIAGFTVTGFLDAAAAHGVAAAPINTAADLLAWPHLRERGFFETVTAPGADGPVTFTVPGRPWRYHRTTLPARGVAPGPTPAPWHEALSWWPDRPALGRGGTPPTTTAAPLAGVRVIDLTWVWAGPYATLQLAHLGADVIKIESSERVDVTRRLGPFADEVVGVNRSGYFNQYNQAKRSITLDLGGRRGRDVLRALLVDADVVIDNMRAGALERMGFPYAELRRINPRIVAVSMSGFGETGPERDRMAYGSIIDAMSGVATINGPVGGGPTDFPMSLPDPCAGIHAAIATVAAVLRARATGEGERVECSMLEASIAALPWPVLVGAATGREPAVIGNRDELAAPHDVYRCAGTYEWLAVSVRADEQFRALAAAIGRADLADDPALADLAGRRAHADRIDEAITAFTSLRSPAEVAAALGAAGVPCAPVAHIDALCADETLAARGFFLEPDHPEIGPRRMAGVAWRASRSPMSVTAPAPCLGADTRTVLAELLGLDDAALDELSDDGVLH